MHWHTNSIQMNLCISLYLYRATYHAKQAERTLLLALRAKTYQGGQTVT